MSFTIPATRYTRKVWLKAGRNRGVTGGYGFSFMIDDGEAMFLAVGLWNKFGQRSLTVYNGL